MTANALGISYTDIQKVIAMELNWDRTPGNWSTAQTSDFAIILKDGLRQFYFPPVLPGERSTHDWNFLYPIAQLDMVASSSASTITASKTGAGEVEVILASGTWPSWAAQGSLYYTGTDGTAHAVEVDTRHDDTTLYIPNLDTYEASSGTTYTLHRIYYDLPDDFGGLNSDTFNFRRDANYYLPEIKMVGESDLRSADRDVQVCTWPRYFSLTYVAPTASQSSRARVRFYPLPEGAYNLDYRYRAIPPTLDGSTYVYPYGGAEHADTILASIVDKAYQRIRSSDEKHQPYLERLRASVLHDRRQNSPHTLGFGPRSAGRGYAEDLRDARRRTPYANINTSF